MPHRIRLRKPWTRHETTEHAAEAARKTVRQVDVPDHEGETELPVEEVEQSEGRDRHEVSSRPPRSEAGRSSQREGGESCTSSEDEVVGSLHQVTYCRRFHCPSGIEPGDRVQLEVGEVVGELAAIGLNSTVIASCQEDRKPKPGRYDITNHLTEHNELEIEIHQRGKKPRLSGEVNLWILTPENPA